MPAPIRRLRMSPDAYHLLPFHPGWKIEYIHGEAVFQPREAFAYGALPVRPPTSHAPAGVAVHPLDSVDATALIELFHDAFSETPEYAGWSDETFAKEPRRVVHDFLAGKRGAISPASRVAVRDGALVGAAFLVAHDAGAALLDVLMIAPAAQRRGIATALATAALAHLAATGGGRLISRWHLANEASVAWHRRQGFIEEPDFF